jgi:DNA-binding MarR family transcriptional regulator
MKLTLPQSYQEVFTLIGELSRALRCCQQEEAFCLDLTLSQFFILHSIAGQGKIQLAELHGLLSVEKSTTTRMVSPLIRRGLVIQERAEHDSRALNLKLTSRGEEVYRTVWGCLAEFIDTIRNQIPRDERKRVFEGTQVFLKALQDAGRLRPAGKRKSKGENHGCCQRPNRHANSSD